MKCMYKQSALVLVMVSNFMLVGCGGFSIWPFGKAEVKPIPGKPVDAREYACDAGKKFYIRTIENGNAVWLILSDREVALAKVSGSEPTLRYSNKISTLELNGNDAALEITADNSWKGCKLVSITP